MPLYTLQYFYGRMAGLKLIHLSQSDALEHYKTALSYGNSRSATDLFAIFGIDFPVTATDIRAAAGQLATLIQNGVA